MRVIFLIAVVIAFSSSASTTPWVFKPKPDPARSYIGPPPPGNRTRARVEGEWQSIARARIHVRALSDSSVLQSLGFQMVTFEYTESTDTSTAFVAYWFEDPDWNMLPPEILGIEYPTTLRRRTRIGCPKGPPADYPVEKHLGIEYVRSYVTVSKETSTDWFERLGFMHQWQPEELQTDSTALYDGLLPLELDWLKLPKELIEVSFPETATGRFDMPCNSEVALNCVNSTAALPAVDINDGWERDMRQTAWLYIDSFDSISVDDEMEIGIAPEWNLDTITNEANRGDPRIVVEAFFPIDYPWHNLPSYVHDVEFFYREHLTPEQQRIKKILR